MSPRAAVLLLAACSPSAGPLAPPPAGAWVVMLASSGTVENDALGLTAAGERVAVSTANIAGDRGTLVVRAGEARREQTVATSARTGGRPPASVLRLGPGGELRGLDALELGGRVLASAVLVDGVAAIGRYDAAVGMATIAASAPADGGAFVASLDVSGRPRWARAIGGGVAMAVTGMPDGGLAIAGFFGEALTIAGAPDASLEAVPGGRPLFVARFAADGQLRWLRGAESGQVVPALLGASADGGVRVVGGCDGQAVLRGATAQRTIECGTPGQVFAAAYTVEGELAWFTGLPGKVDAMNLRGVALADGGVALAGAFGETIGGGGFPVVTATPGKDAFVARIGPGGEPRWLRHVRGPGIEFVRAVAADVDGSVWALAIADDDAEIVDGEALRPASGALLLQYDVEGALARMTRLADVVRTVGEARTGLSPDRVAVGGGAVHVAGTVFGEVRMTVGASQLALSAPTAPAGGSGFVVGFPVAAVPPP